LRRALRKASANCWCRSLLRCTVARAPAFVRILAKRLRYALDFLSVALPKSTFDRYLTALSDLQDVLGELGDAAVATALRKITWSDPILQVAGDGLRRAADQTPSGAGLLALAETAPPWDQDGRPGLAVPDSAARPREWAELADVIGQFNRRAVLSPQTVCASRFALSIPQIWYLSARHSRQLVGSAIRSNSP
jgi:hypothetical protein